MAIHSSENNVILYLNAPLFSVDTTVVVVSAGLMPIVGKLPARAEVKKVSGDNIITRELIDITNYTGTTLTITRAVEKCPKDSTTTVHTQTAFDFDKGDIIELTFTAGMLEEIKTEVSAKLNLSGGSLSGLLLNAPSCNIASASSVNLSTATSNSIHITGTTGITGFTGVTQGIFFITFDGILTLTHNSTSFILPTGANIVTQVGDSCILSVEGSNCRVIDYMRKDGSGLISSVAGNTQSSVVYGESITAGQPIYISTGAGGRTSGRAYKASSLLTTYSDMGNFVGFAVTTGTVDNTYNCTTAGIDTNQTGLTNGSLYYLTDTAGVISPNPGTKSILVGRATGATSINFLYDKSYGIPITQYTATGSGTALIPTTSYLCTAQTLFNLNMIGYTNNISVVHTYGIQTSTDNSTWTTRWSSSINDSTSATKAHDNFTYIAERGLYVRGFAQMGNGSYGTISVTLSVQT